MAWTEQQKRTIEERDRNILVAAAAGSGKTAVLVERIRRMVEEENIPVDSMLIVTFTNAAASEMKEKIRRSLKEHAAGRPELRKQLDRLSRASISTFHKFALSVMRQFFYLIDLEPDFSICDDAEKTVLAEEAMDELLEQEFEAGREDFYQLLNWYGSERSNDSVRTVIQKIYQQVLALPDPFGTLERRISEMEVTEEEFPETSVFASMKKIIVTRMQRCLAFQLSAQDVLLDEGFPEMAEKFQQDVDAMESMVELAEAGKLEELSQALSGFKAVRMAAPKDLKEAFAEIKPAFDAPRNRGKKERDEVYKQFLNQDISLKLEEIRKTVPVARTVQRLVEAYHVLFQEKKKERKLVDFDDIEHDCLRILTDPEAAAFYRDKYSYIFIDEYQDTSLLQEAIIGKIKRENNLFMVGDIKQSIYKFRLAEPEIFQEKYDRYSREEEKDSIKIDLNRNFRSKPVILEGINDIFRPVMEGYNDDACLYPGLPYEGEYSYPPELKLIDLASMEEMDEALQDLRKEELEALAVCDIIQENLGKPYYDSKTGELKHFRYRDMVILMRAVRGTGSRFYEIMRKRGIPLFIDDNEGYFDTMEINVFMNLLSVIDNPYQDVPFISVLRSEIFGFSTDDLAMVRWFAQDGAYTDAFRKVAAGETEAPEGFVVRCRKVLADLRRWKDMGRYLPLPDFVWKLLLETEYYLMMGAMPDGVQRQANLRALVEKTEKFAQKGQSSLYGFIRYIDNVKKKKVNIGQVRLLGENDNVVRLMTIHKSKGLEFPLVVVCGLGRKLMYGSRGQKVLFHKDVGLGLYLEEPERHLEKKTLPYQVIVSRQKQEEMEEHIRVLYVALTRAREKLYLTGTVDDAEVFLEKHRAGPSGDTNYLAMLDHMPETEVIPAESLSLEGTAPPEGLLQESPDVPADLAETVEQRLSYEYRWKEAQSLRSKYAVSSLNALAHKPVLNREGTEPEDPEAEDRGPDRSPNRSPEMVKLVVPGFLQEEHALTPAEKGNIYHGIMERIDFSRAEEEGLPYIRRFAEELVEAGVILEPEMEAVDLRKIEDFFRSPLGRQCTESYRRGELFREQSFDLVMERDGEEIMVQGIIDCFFLTEEGTVLLDYKTNRIDPTRSFEEEARRLREMYRTQLDLYRQALEGSGLPEVCRSYLYLFSAGREIEV